MPDNLVSYPSPSELPWATSQLGAYLPWLYIPTAVPQRLCSHMRPAFSTATFTKEKQRFKDGQRLEKGRHLVSVNINESRGIRQDGRRNSERPLVWLFIFLSPTGNSTHISGYSGGNWVLHSRTRSSLDQMARLGYGCNGHSQRKHQDDWTSLYSIDEPVHQVLNTNTCCWEYGGAMIAGPVDYRIIASN